MDALRNKTFETKYWSENSVKDAIVGALNAYFNLIPNADNLVNNCYHYNFVITYEDK